MQVETFECTETAAEPVDASAEAIQIIESLGLDGQRQRLCPSKAEGQQTRLPYRQMLKDEEMVYRTLCPSEVKLKDYDAAPIPLRVLQVAAHFLDLMPGYHLFVWDREQAAVKDPVLVATKESYAWRGDARYILARWGEVLEPFAVLMKRAIAARRESLTQQAEKVLAKVRAATDADIVSGSAQIDW